MHANTSNARRTAGALTLALTLALGGCAAAPERSALLADAQQTFQRVSNDPQVATHAAQELQQAQRLLDTAQQQAGDRRQADVVDHYAYLARQTALLAEQRALRVAAEQRIAQSETERGRIQLEARERELERQRRLAEAAQARAEGAQLLAQGATAEAERARLEREQAVREREEALAARQRLEQDLAELEAKRTQRGLVLTLGSDVLFEFDRAELKGGATRAIDRLAEFMREYPERSVLIEGFTDGIGSAEYNLELSNRRAQSVREALLARGIEPERVESVGYGKEYPVASNANEAGRQLNRRVEVVISDEAGRIAAR